MVDILIRFIPVFGIMAIGAFLRSKALLSGSIIDGMKLLIVNLGLPALFFLSFLTVEIRISYGLLFFSVFLYCLLLFGIGKALTRTRIAKDHLNKFFFSGFEFGMVGVALFTSLFGASQLHYIALIGLGHELFIWFVYAPLLQAEERGILELKSIFASFIRSPIIVAILSALALNISGAYHLFADTALYGQVEGMLIMLGQLTTPLILLALGAQLTFSGISWRDSAALIASRLVLLAVTGPLFMLGVHLLLFPLEPMMIYAFVTFLMLPPPYIIPVFLGNRHKEEALFYNRTLILYTVCTLVLYPLVMVILQ